MTTIRRFGQVVADRRLEAVAGDRAGTPGTVRVPDPSGGEDWFCPHLIEGLGDDTVGGASGVDSLQALLLSVHALHLQLDQRAQEASVRLEWLGLPGTALTVDPASYLGWRPGD